MPVVAVVGSQWGDEGKGHVVDFLAARADLVIRFQGGGNAGHTVVNEYGCFPLHLVPCGVFQRRCTCLIGTGVVVTPKVLLAELENLERHGVDTARVFISERAHLVLPHHILLDGLEEEARGARAVGTTRQGIGPAYADKAARVGIQIGDLLEPDYFVARLRDVLQARGAVIRGAYGAEPPDPDAVAAEYLDYGRRLADRIIDPRPLVQDALRREALVILEGQLGVMRDLDWGHYPWVTSSSPIAGGACAGAGLPPHAIKHVVGVVKAFSTAVGAGPLPTELSGEEAELLRRGGPEEGWEFGATTGRPRRCGWLDLVAVRHAAAINGLTSLAVTKLDVLDQLPRIPVCVDYRDPATGKTYEQAPVTRIMERAQPIYEELPGWERPTGDVRRFDDLPRQAQRYLRTIEAAVGVPVSLVTVGPAREQTIRVREEL